MPSCNLTAPEALSRACRHRLCGEQSVPSAIASSATDTSALFTTEYRLPSTRPIDHRWDRSRGIIFSSLKRKFALDNTWNPSIGIAFAQPLNPSRGYASRAISSSNPPSNFGHTDEDFAVSFDQVRKLKKEGEAIRERADNLEIDLAKVIAERDVHLRKTEGLQSENLRLKQEIDDAKQERDLAKVEVDRLAKREQHNEATIEHVSRDKARYESELSRLREESAPDRHRNEVVLNAVRELAISETKSKMLLQISQLTSDLREEGVARQSSEALLEEREKENRTLRGELHLQKVSLDSQRKQNITLQSELSGRRERRLVGRSNYSLYRDLFSKFHFAIVAIQERVHASESISAREHQLRQTAAREFDRTKIISKLSENHPEIARKISDFLRRRVSVSSGMPKTVTDLLEELKSLIADYSEQAHTSRQLTRFHRFEDLTHNATAHLREVLIGREPFLRYLRRIDHTILGLRAELGSAPLARRHALQLSLEGHTVDGQLTKLLSRLATATLEVQDTRERLLDDFTEKRDFVALNTTIPQINSVVGQYEVARGVTDFNKTLLHEFRTIHFRLAPAVTEFLSMSRRESHLLAELKQADNEEKHLNVAISRLVVDAERKRQRIVTKLARRTKQKPTPVDDLGDRNLSQAAEVAQNVDKRERRLSTSRARRATRDATIRINLTPTASKRACSLQVRPGDVEDLAHVVNVALTSPSYGKPQTPHNATSNGESSPTDDSGDIGRGKRAYQISSKDFDTAANAAPGTAGSYWTFKLYRDPDGNIPKVYYCQTFDKAEERAKQFLEEQVVGFDLEWEPLVKGHGATIKESVSLIQIACEDKIGLFHIARFHGKSVQELLPPSLRTILESPHVVKAGVNIAGDATRMRKWLNVEMCGVIELSRLYRIVTFSEDKPENVNFKPVSMLDQVQEVLKFPLKKDSVRVSQWSKSLESAQADYAATDAYAGYQLYHHLEEKRELMQPTPPGPAFVELDQPLILGNGNKIYKSQRKTTVARKGRKGGVVEIEEKVAEDASEDDEFVDALENPESVDSVTTDDRDWPATIAYPHLPPQDCVQGFESDQSFQDQAILPISEAPKDAPISRVEYLKSPETRLADEWVTDWHASHVDSNKVAATRRMLQVYHLWHHQNIDLEQVGRYCRSPPLAISTVAYYILSSISEAGLPYDANRVLEPAHVLPASMRSRYGKILDHTDE